MNEQIVLVPFHVEYIQRTGSYRTNVYIFSDKYNLVFKLKKGLADRIVYNFISKFKIFVQS